MEFPETEPERVVVVGICAMAKKSRSRPMREIVVRLKEFDSRIKVSLVRILIFSFDDTDWFRL